MIGTLLLLTIVAPATVADLWEKACDVDPGPELVYGDCSSDDSACVDDCNADNTASHNTDVFTNPASGLCR